MSHPGKSFFSLEFVKFLASGGLAAAINYGSRFLYSQYFQFEIAVLLAYVTGMAFAFLLFKYFVFGHSQHQTNKQAGLFIVVNLLALAQTWLISVLLADHLLIARLGTQDGEALAHFIGVLFPVFSSFIGHKYFTFKR